MRATVNSDDPAYFPGYMNENLIALERGAKLTRDELVQLARNAFAISWLPHDERAAYVERARRRTPRRPTDRA